MKENIVITGSSGLIGTKLVRFLRDRYSVFGLDQKLPDNRNDLAAFIKTDFSSSNSIYSAVKQIRTSLVDTRIASVLHLAAYYDFSGEPSPLYEQVNVKGTETLIQSLKGMPVDQFVFSSSMLVYRPCKPGQRIHEESPLEPKWDYPRSKIEAEKAIAINRGTIPVVFLRIAGVYDDRCHSIPLADQIRRIFENRLISHVYPGDISRGQSFVHLEDLVGVFNSVLEKRLELSDESIFLIGEPETISYEELQRKIGFFLHKEYWETRSIPKAVAKMGAWLQGLVPGDQSFIKPWMIDRANDHYELDVSLAKRILGWRPKHSLRNTLPRMLELLKANPHEFYSTNKLGAKAIKKGESHAA